MIDTFQAGIQHLRRAHKHELRQQELVCKKRRAGN
jgi:hypothetical protein